jgi:hypothetical protein
MVWPVWPQRNCPGDRPVVTHPQDQRESRWCRGPAEESRRSRQHHAQQERCHGASCACFIVFVNSIREESKAAEIGDQMVIESHIYVCIKFISIFTITLICDLF